MAADLTAEDVGNMKVAELRAELKARDLSTSGLKKDLADRLLEHLASGGAAMAAEPAEANGDAPAAPGTGTDVPDTAAPSGDSTAQTSGEAAPVLASSEQAGTDDLPAELPAIPPVTEDSVDDFTGAEGTIAQETATEGVERSDEPSEVHRPPPDHLDKTPGFVADSREEEAREKSEVVPLNEPAVLPGDEEASHKRKRDEEPTVSAPETAVASVAEQEETSAPANVEITADPAAAAILNGEPEAKRSRTDGDAPAPVVEDLSVDVDTNGASTSNGSTFPTSVITPGISESSIPSSSSLPGGASTTGNLPEVVTLNEPQKPATDFASASAADAVAAAAAATPAIGGEQTNEARDGTEGGTTPEPRSLNTQGSPPIDKNSIEQKENIDNNNVASSSSSKPLPSASQITNQSEKAVSDQQTKPPISRSICVSNLVRPFTLQALKEKLEDFGEMDYFWINSVKSHCFVTYQTTDVAQHASSSLEGEIWPEAVGKPLAVTYLPTDKIPSLVEKEEAAGRTRLELTATFDSESNEWQYDVLAPAAGSGKALGHAPPVPRGLASSMPFQQARGVGLNSAAGPSGVGRLDPRNMVTATSASGAAIQLPSNSGFAQSRPPGMRGGPAAVDADRPWAPKAGAEDLYSRTKAVPPLYYREVDKVAAGRRLRELERGPYIPRGGPVDRRGPPPSYRNTYRP